MRICLRCGKNLGGVEWRGVKHRWDCYGCKLTWWEQMEGYDGRPMQYIDRVDMGFVMEVPMGCMAVFSGEVV